MLQPLTSHVVGRGAAPAPLPDAAPAAAAPEPTEFDVDAILGQRGFYFSERTLPLDLGQLGRREVFVHCGDLELGTLDAWNLFINAELCSLHRS